LIGGFLVSWSGNENLDLLDAGKFAVGMGGGWREGG